ncbi:MAG TPA: NAD(P)-dependent oxidoreductase, partial [Candidatus Dojkabacteria bacterium]
MEGEKIKNTSKYPTSLIVRGLNYTGIEIAKTLVEQGGYVIIIDELSFQVEELIDQVGDERLITILDMASISSLEENIRRLDYVYYFGHESKSYLQEISTQEFLQQSNYLDTILDLSLKFEAKFLLTTSIKAHQLTLETTNLNLDNPSNNFSSPNYTETEVQRYAENLVLEYNEKLGLDSRIIRVGEILGKGLNPNMDSSYLELILNAVKGESLKIRGDGLETDFYIHYIDAARGLIKSMFSQATKGRVYSLAIPEEISTLSIAYKVSELEPGAGRIEFVENDNKLPPLRLYKPAPNLESIGWENKIGLERSIAQTIEYVKEKEDQFFPGKGTSKGEALTEESENVYPDPANFEGALARLISERKLHEKSRIGSVVLANEKLREKLKSRNSSSIVKKVSRNSFWIFENFKSQFRFLKNITLREFIFYTILLFLIFLGYIFILSPILNIVGNGITIYRKISNIESSLNDNDFKNISSNLSSINSDISEIQLRFEEIRYIFTVSGNIERYNNIQNSLEIQHDYVEGLYNSFVSIVPIAEHLNQPNSKIVLRESDESLIEVQASSNTLSVSQVENNFSSLQLGIEKLKINNEVIVSSFNIYPGFIKDPFAKKFEFLKTQVETINGIYANYEYIPPLLGLDGQTNYLIITQDNTRYTPSGGYYSSYIYLEVDNGVISDAEANSLNI